MDNVTRSSYCMVDFGIFINGARDILIIKFVRFFIRTR